MSKLHLNNLRLPKSAAQVAASLISFVAVPLPVFGHGFAGDRFFPATLATDDPFVANELSLPTFQAIRQPGDQPTRRFLSAEESMK